MLQFNLLPSSAQDQVGVLLDMSEGVLEKKVCTGPCGRDLLLDAFGRFKEGKYGRRSKCNECRAQEEKKRRANHPATEEQREAARVRTKEWARVNPERARANALKTYLANPDRAKAAAKAWQKRNPEKVRKLRADWVSRNRVVTREYARQWQASNRELYHKIQKKWRTENQTYWRVRDASLRKVTSNFTLAQWLEVLEEFGHRCAYCLCGDQKLTMDHVIPVAKGGEHVRENIVPACKSCNSRKKDRSIFYMLEAKGV
jgi:5-methylcytosine-specific restriction endonuclease McrA